MRPLTGEELHSVFGGQQQTTETIGVNVVPNNIAGQLLITNNLPGTYALSVAGSTMTIVNLNTGANVFSDSTMKIAADGNIYASYGITMQLQFTDSSGNNLINLTPASATNPMTDINVSYDYVTGNQAFAEASYGIGNLSMWGAMDEGGQMYFSNWDVSGSGGGIKTGQLAISPSDILVVNATINAGFMLNGSSSDYLSGGGSNTEFVLGLGLGFGPNNSVAVLSGTPQYTANLNVSDQMTEVIDHIMDATNGVITGWSTQLNSLDQAVIDGMSNDPSYFSGLLGPNPGSSSGPASDDDYSNGENSYTVNLAGGYYEGEDPDQPAHPQE